VVTAGPRFVRSEEDPGGMRADFRYPDERRPYEALDADLLEWASRVGDFDQTTLYAVADGLSRLVTPGRYWMNSAEVRGLIERQDPGGMAGPRFYRITQAGRQRLAELRA
jgi:hypothetical protein